MKQQPQVFFFFGGFLASALQVHFPLIFTPGAGTAQVFFASFAFLSLGQGHD